MLCLEFCETAPTKMKPPKVSLNPHPTLETAHVVCTSNSNLHRVPDLHLSDYWRLPITHHPPQVLTAFGSDHHAH